MKLLSKGTAVLLAALALPVSGFIFRAASAQCGTVSDPGGGAILQAKQTYGRLPMSFEPNRGQTDQQVSFLSRGSGYNLFLTRDESVLVLRKGAETEGRARLHGPPHLRHAPPKFETPSVVRMKFLGANPDPAIDGADRLPGSANYLHSRDSGKWRTDVAQYGRVEYHDLYPGVDLVYYGNQAGGGVRLEHDFVVRPGSDPAKIRLGFEGVERLELNASGELVLRLPDGGELIQHAPVIYQESEGTRVTLTGGYVIHGGNPEDPAASPSIGFTVAAYDPGKTLYIDPLLSYSTYLGGTDYDFAYGIAVDTAGCAYVTGWSYSADFPTKKPIQLGNAGGVDVFVAKLNAAGNALLYSTFVGGSGDDYGLGIAVDTTGAAYVTGYTDSTDFPTVAGGISAVNAGSTDAFVFKINATGTALSYSTYLGGTGDDYATGIAVGTTGMAYVTGYTSSTNFPTTTPYQAAKAGLVDAFVVKLNAAGTAAVYSTYLGGAGEDYATAIALDTTGRVYITGYTKSVNFPMSNAYQAANAGGWDAFVTALAAAGTTLYYSTYLGGTGDDFGYAATVVADSVAPNHICAYVTGTTSSADLPTRSTAVGGNAYQMSNAGNYDAFASKLDPALVGVATLVYSTYLGGEDFDAGNGIAVDSTNNAYIVGETWSERFPVKGSPFQGVSGGMCDGFVAKINATGSALSYGSYMGGTDYDAAMAVAGDSAGNMYLAGYTYSIGFPVVVPLTSGNSGLSDAFAAKIGAAAPPQPDLTVSAMTTPVYGVAGQKITVSTTVKNNGVSTSAASKIGIYLSVTQTPAPWSDSRSVYLGSRSVPSLKLSAVSAATTILAIPPNIKAGAYYLVAVADSGGTVEESNEANNILAKAFTVYANRPDLICASVAGPVAAKQGQTVSITNSIKNQGYATARNFYVALYLSIDTTITSADTLIGFRLVSSLIAGGGNTVVSSVQIPPTLAAGTYYIGAIVDDANDVVEIGETNNSKLGNKIVISP